jgi:hypothetical protein
MSNTDHIVHDPQDTLDKLLSVFTMAQLRRVANHAASLSEQGFGTLAITFSKGKPQLLERSQTEQLRE